MIKTPEWIITRNNLLMRFNHSGELEVFCWRSTKLKWDEVLDTRHHKPRFDSKTPACWHVVEGTSGPITKQSWSFFPKSFAAQVFEKEEGLLAVVLYLQKNPSINEHTEVLLKSVR